jgi:ubiquinone/menaquinone biosynthesis C-methylase UbiE
MPWHSATRPSPYARLLAAALAAATLTLGCAVADEAASEPPAVAPHLNDHYRDANPERWRRVFESQGREVFDQRFRIVQATGVRPGMDVADVGAGTGFFSMLFARAVGPEGTVYAVDISPTFGAAIRERSAEFRVDNVETIVNDQQSTHLPPGSVDLVFLSDTYHHFEYPRAMLASIREALRPGGELAVIDFHRKQGASSTWVMSHVRLGRDEAVDEIEAAGFELIGEEDFLRENYFLRFRRTAD